MNNTALELVSSYEHIIVEVERVIVAAFEMTASPESGLDSLDGERERLEAGIEELLAKNCSLRRKDFGRHMEAILAELETKRREIETERRAFMSEVKAYLAEQKELAGTLREQVNAGCPGKPEKAELESVKERIKATCDGKGEELFRRLLGIRRRFRAFELEYQEVNNRLQRLVDRGESLRIEHLRQLEAEKARCFRRDERESRQQDVERMLARFRQQRGETRQH